MPILPVALSRVSEPLKSTRLLSQLNADQLAIQRQYDQLSTGQRVSRFSDDPAAAGRAIILQRGISRAEQLSRNAGVTESFYTATDSALARLGDALIDSRGATVESAQNILSADERAAYALTVRQSLEAAVAAGNSLFRDHQLLGGVLQSKSALQYDGADVVFSGTDAIAKTNVRGGALIPIGVSGAETLGLANTFFRGESLNPGLDRSTPLLDLRGGRGVEPGLLRISNGGNFVEVDLRSASSLGDVVDVLNAIELDNRQLLVTIQPDGITIAYADGAPGTLAIDDAAGETLAKDLSILNPLGLNAPPIVADGLKPRVTESTLLSKLNDGVGINVSSGLQIQTGGNSVTVDLSNATTVTDILVAINRSGADVKAQLNKTTGGIDIRALRSGVEYSIGENGGNAATTLGIRTATGETKLTELDNNRGIIPNSFGPDFSITRPDGTTLNFDLDGAETIDDVLDLIRNHPSNQDPLRVIPGLNPVGNGIQLIAPPGFNPITVRAGEIGNAAEMLGLVDKGQEVAVGFTSGPFAIFNGDDYAAKEAGGTIDTLIRLETAVRDGDVREIERLQALLDTSLDTANRTRGRIGVWSQNVQVLQAAADDQVILLKSELSTEIDADLATVISELNQRQVSLEASLKLIGQTAQLTLLDFL